MMIFDSGLLFESPRILSAFYTSRCLEFGLCDFSFYCACTLNIVHCFMFFFKFVLNVRFVLINK